MSRHTFKSGLITTLVASGSITKRRFIKASGAQCNAIGELAIGVSGEEDTDNGKTFAVQVRGTGLVEAGEALDAGMAVTTNGLGKAIRATKGRYVNGTVMRSIEIAGDLVEIMLGGGFASTVPTTTSTTTSSTSTTTTTTTAA